MLTSIIPSSSAIMWYHIDSGDNRSVRELLNTIIWTTEVETKKKAVQEARKYILGNWEEIMRQCESEYVGCSVEGHVSHILFSRLSSRPMSWCKIGVDQMTRLRVYMENSVDVYEIYMKRKKAAAKEAREAKIDQEINRK